MRKTILIFCAALATLGLTAFGVMNWNGSETDSLETAVNEDLAINTEPAPIVGPKKKTFPDFMYDVGPRFAPIKKGNLVTAKSINDFFNEEEIKAMVSLKSVNIIVIKDEGQTNIREIGYSKVLTEAQLKLLQSFDYSTNFSIRANLEYRSFNPYFTIVPEKQAEYAGGMDALIEYLRENSKEAITDVQVNKLRPAKLYFTVTKKGTLENARIGNHSGYPEVDKKMIELISNTPWAWHPAEDSKGEKVNQELVISFGLLGC